MITKLGSVGRPCLYLELDIWDETGTRCPPGSGGDRDPRPQGLQGLLARRRGHRGRLHRGLVPLGDIGVRDEDGYLFIVDRLKDMIVSGGENIASSEIERVLYEHDSVLEAAVVGRPDARWGEVPVAFVSSAPAPTPRPTSSLRIARPAGAVQGAEGDHVRRRAAEESLGQGPQARAPGRRLSTAKGDGDDMSNLRGPITGGKGWPFGLPTTDLAAVGYRADEYFVDGEADRFGPVAGTELGRDGRWQVEPVGRAPYKTRLVVLRPVDAAAFNGTVVVLWNNVTAGYDNFTGGDSPEVFENGYAYVAASVQRVGVHGQPDNPQGLRDWDPERYGSLSIPSDDYSFDIYTQVADLVAPDRPRGGSTRSRAWTCAGSSPRAHRSRRRGWRPTSTACSRSHDASTPSSS